MAGPMEAYGGYFSANRGTDKRPFPDRMLPLQYQQERELKVDDKYRRCVYLHAVV